MNKAQNQNLFWIRVPVRVDSVARKLVRVEEWRQDQSRLFDKEIV